MLRLMILRAWPALIPILIYLLWLYTRRRKAKKADEPLPALLDGPWLYTLMGSVALLAISLIATGLMYDHNEGTGYQPKRFEDGKLIEEELR